MLAIPSRHRSLTLLAVVLGLQLLLLAAQIKREQQVRLIRVWAIEVRYPARPGGGVDFRRRLRRVERLRSVVAYAQGKCGAARGARPS